MSSLLKRLGERLRRAVVGACQVAGVGLVLLATSTVFVLLVGGVALLALAQKLGRRDSRRREIIIVPA